MPRCPNKQCTEALPPPPPQGEPCPTDGVALWALRAFVEEHAAQARGRTTGAVCHEVVKPATRGRQCAYVELLRGSSRGGVPAVARATVFLSHAWGNPLDSLVDAAEARLGGEARTAYVWLDILTVNQHNATCQNSGCPCGSQRALPPQSWWSGACSCLFCVLACLRVLKIRRGSILPWRLRCLRIGLQPRCALMCAQCVLHAQ